MKTRILSFFMYILAIQVSAQTYSFRPYNLKDGLPEISVYAIEEDNLGYVWFGTESGVARTDGKSFKTLTVNDGLAHNVFRSLLSDTRGRLWMGTFGGGLSMLDGDSIVNFTTKNGIGSNAILGIFEDSKGRVWVGTDGGGISCYENGKFKTWSVKEGLLHNVVYSFQEDEKGRILIGTYKGLSVFDGNRFENYSSLENPLVVKAITKSNSRILIGGSNGLFEYKSGVCTKIANEKINSGITSIAGTEPTGLWIGMGNGLVKITSKNNQVSFEKFTVQSGLCDNDVRALKIDRAGNLWVGTAGNGISKFMPNGFVIYNTSTGVPNAMVFSILADKNNNIWMGTNGGGVAVLENDKLKIIDKKNGLPNNFVCSLLEDKKGNVWIGMEGGGASMYNGKRFLNFTATHGLAGNIVIAMKEDSKGNIWFTTGGNGVSKYDGKKFTNYTVDSGLANNYVRPVIEDRKGNIWFGTEGGGVSCFDGKKFTNYNSTHGLANDFVRAMLEDSKGNLWFATQRGLCKFDGKGKFKTYNKSSGMTSENLLQLVEDNSGNIWIGHFEGIEKFDPVSEKFRYYGYLEGFMPMENNGRAICKDKDGNIWFGTINGAVKYIPSLDKTNEIEPLTHLVKVYVNDQLKDGWYKYSYKSDLYVKSQKMPDDFKLGFDENNMRFDFVGIHQNIPEKILYSYKLEGFDKDWSEPGTLTTVNYTNLKSGDYVFLVKSCNNDGVWNKEPLQFNFTIKPPYWQTWWFYLTELAIFLILLAASFYFNKTDSTTKTATVLTFLCLALVFEVATFYLEPFVDQLISNSGPFLKIISNIVLGGVISPAESFLKKVIWRIS